jgi:hypothetical protein
METANTKEILWEGIASSRKSRIVKKDKTCYSQEFIGDSVEGSWHSAQYPEEVYRVAFLGTLSRLTHFLEQSNETLRNNNEALERHLDGTK